MLGDEIADSDADLLCAESTLSFGEIAGSGEGATASESMASSGTPRFALASPNCRPSSDFGAAARPLKSDSSRMTSAGAGFSAKRSTSAGGVRGGFRLSVGWGRDNSASTRAASPAVAQINCCRQRRNRSPKVRRSGSGRDAMGSESASGDDCSRAVRCVSERATAGSAANSRASCSLVCRSASISVRSSGD